MRLGSERGSYALDIEVIVALLSLVATMSAAMGRKRPIIPKIKIKNGRTFFTAVQTLFFSLRGGSWAEVTFGKLLGRTGI